uniref:Uncharacterized protein n=1 Tax=Colletotrichum fructicola (strain Nara gc5) TaxID=1213859 RepID=L2G741_COLFN
MTSDAASKLGADIVGWTPGPETRGTLSLVWSCVITIFACTWTVLHLNVPGRDEKPLAIALRKAKWMAINMFFPEFIFSKAVCDLRLALDELRDFEENLLSLKKSSDCLRLDPSESTSTENIQKSPRRRKVPVRWRTIQTWTIVHSYYAQMGGLLHPSPTKPYQGSAKDQSYDPIYYCLTGSKLTSRYRWNLNQPPPLDNLILRDRDVKDKSKADWLLKTIAVFQIAWLILGVTIRGIIGLPITQLEIATVSFAVMAMLTYAANWWKPKDISQPTILQKFRGRSEVEVQSGSQTQSFMRWIWSPAKAADEARIVQDVSRVPNDVVSMEGHAPYMIVLMTFSSLAFGALHCLAWNFEFPSRTELLAWRVASLVAAVLPATTLGISLLLIYLITDHVELILLEQFLAKLEPLLESNPYWLQRSSVENPDRKPENVTTPMHTPETSQNGYEPQTEEESNQQDNQQTGNSTEYWQFYRAIKEFRRLWGQAQEMRPDRKSTASRADILRYSWFASAKRLKDCSHSHVVRQYEDFIRAKDETSMRYVYRLPSDIERIGQAHDEVMGNYEKSVSLRKALKPLPQALVVCSGVIYAVARLTTLVLMFTCLRQTPVGVYQVTPWIKFLPNIS